MDLLEIRTGITRCDDYYKLHQYYSILSAFNFIYPNTYFELFVCHLFYSLNKCLPSVTPTYLCRAILTGKILIGHSKVMCLTVGKE